MSKAVQPQEFLKVDVSKPLLKVALPVSLSARLFLFTKAVQPQEFLKVDVSKPLVKVALPVSLSARLFLFTTACPRQYSHRSF